jgi:hypothetical protein
LNRFDDPAVPVHRQMLPDSSSRISVSVGCGLRSRSACAAMISPGVQKPHCTAPQSTNDCCTSLGRPGEAIPSTVTIS